MKKSKPPDDTMNHSLSTRSDSLSDYSHLNQHKYSVREEPRITTVLSPQTRTTRYECIWTMKNGEIEGTDSLLAEASSLVAWTATLLLCASAPELAMADRLLYSHKATYKLQLCRVDKSQISTVGFLLILEIKLENDPHSLLKLFLAIFFTEFSN